VIAKQAHPTITVKQDHTQDPWLKNPAKPLKTACKDRAFGAQKTLNRIKMIRKRLASLTPGSRQAHLYRLNPFDLVQCVNADTP
jgi:hypothetical protein